MGLDYISFAGPTWGMGVVGLNEWAYLREEVTEELVNVMIVDGLSLVQQYGIHIVNEEAGPTQRFHTELVYMLRLVDLIP